MIMRPVRILSLSSVGVRSERAVERSAAAPCTWNFGATKPRTSRHEDLRSKAIVEALEVFDRHAAGEAGGDDRAGRGAADEIEIVAEQEIRVISPLSEKDFNGLEEFERENAPNASAVEREDALWPGVGIEMLSLCERQLRVSPCNLFHRVSRRRKFGFKKTNQMSGAG